MFIWMVQPHSFVPQPVTQLGSKILQLQMFNIIPYTIRVCLFVKTLRAYNISKKTTVGKYIPCMDGMRLDKNLSFWLNEGEHDEQVSVYLFEDSCEMQHSVSEFQYGFITGRATRYSFYTSLKLLSPPVYWKGTNKRSYYGWSTTPPNEPPPEIRPY